MSALERIRESKARFIPPMAMTAYRIPASVMTVVEAYRGNWGATQAWLTTGVISDKESPVADFFNARSKAGAIADPIADGALRAAGVAAFAPHANSAALVVTAALEIDSARMNKTIQNPQDEDPIIPTGAKYGTALEGAGAIVFVEGMRRESSTLRHVGEALFVLGAATRWGTYRNLYNRAKNADPVK